MFGKGNRRLITPESRRISRGEAPDRKASSPLTGLVIESAEGLRWAHAQTILPKAALPVIILVEENQDIQIIQNAEREE